MIGGLIKYLFILLIRRAAVSRNCGMLRQLTDSKTDFDLMLNNEEFVYVMVLMENYNF